ncbi:MAG: DUF6442 family protein [Bacilli bacterium]|jgi:hypothetical protein
MKNKKIVPLICLTLGIVLVIFCLIGKGLEIFETYKTLFGIMLGVGSGLFGGGLGQLINVYLLDKDPVLKRKKEIETNDERNIYISNRAKSKAFNTMEYIFPIAIFIGILLDTDFIIILIMLTAYLSIYVVYIYYLNKYLKKM